MSAPPVTICVLTFGNYAPLARRCVGSIFNHCPRHLYRLVVGGNALGTETEIYLRALEKQGTIDRLLLSEVNLWKCPMMRRMWEGLETEFVWWFDDDSYVTGNGALPERLRLARASPPEIMMWGQIYFCQHRLAFWNGDPVDFVRKASWYQGLTPPFWEPGGKGELNFEGKGTGDGRWLFAVGGCWFARTSALRQLDWPDRRLETLGEDVFLGEAMRQQGWQLQEIGALGVAVNTAERRWTPPPTQDERFGPTARQP